LPGSAAGAPARRGAAGTRRLTRHRLRSPSREGAGDGALAAYRGDPRRGTERPGSAAGRAADEEEPTMLDHVWNVDPEVARALVAETRRQADTLEMIASENFVSE